MMNSGKRISILIMSLLLSLIAGMGSAQTSKEEAFLEEFGDDADAQLLEKLQALRDHPLDLNRVSQRTLLRIPSISPLLAKKIVSERMRNGPYLTLQDFKERLKLDPDLFAFIAPYITVLKSIQKKPMDSRLRLRIQKDFPATSGYLTSAYAGTPWKTYQRWTFSQEEDFRGGVLMEKDPGETLWNDHWVGFLEVDNLPYDTRLIAGHYRVEAGQGLVFWNTYASPKGADPVATAIRSSDRFRGYASTDENQYFTGCAVETGSDKVRLMLVLSQSPLDATLNDNGSARTLTTSGLHRTETEQTQKNRMSETLLGGRLRWKTAKVTVGISGFWSAYSKSVDKQDTERYHFDFYGTNNTVVGFDYNCLLRNISLSGEIALSSSRGWAFIGNGIIDLGKTDLVVLMRRFDPDFHNPHGRGFAADDAQNEEGVYVGLAGRLSPSTRFSVFYDFLRRPWRTYSIPVPSMRDDFFLQCEQKIAKGTELVFRARIRRSDSIQDARTVSGIETETLQTRNHWLFRIECRYRPTSKLRFRIRLETSSVFYPAVTGDIVCPAYRENGFLLYQDIRVTPVSGLTLSARWISFDTDSYDSRIYEFESDLPGVMTIKALYGRGTRWYFLLRWKTKKWMHLSFKVGTTYHDGVSTWGSGDDEFTGDTEQTLGLHADFIF